MDATVGVTADVGTEHDVVLGVTVQVGLLSSSGVDLNVSTTTVEVLFVLDGVLDHQGLSLLEKLGNLAEAVKKR
jgi:hypothetical protein